MLCHVGQLASSKSVMYVGAPQLSALMSIFRSGGPVISTRLSCNASGIGAIFQSPSLTSFVSGRKSGISPALIRSCRSWRACSRSSTLGVNSLASLATKATASGLRIPRNSSGTSLVTSIPSPYALFSAMIGPGSFLTFVRMEKL
jgi:hypothetical protein